MNKRERVSVSDHADLLTVPRLELHGIIGELCFSERVI